MGGILKIALPLRTVQQPQLTSAPVCALSLDGVELEDHIPQNLMIKHHVVDDRRLSRGILTLIRILFPDHR